MQCLGSIKVFNQNVDADTAEEIVTMAYENGKLLSLTIYRRLKFDFIKHQQLLWKLHLIIRCIFRD